MIPTDDLIARCIIASDELEKISISDVSNVPWFKRRIYNVAIQLLWATEHQASKRFCNGDFVATDIMWRMYYPHMRDGISDFCGVVCGKVGTDGGFHVVKVSTKEGTKYVHPYWLRRSNSVELFESGYFENVKT